MGLNFKRAGAVALALFAWSCEGSRELEPRAAVLGAPAEPVGGGPTVLLFSRTQGFRHGSIDEAVPALQMLGQPLGWTVDATEDSAVFSEDNLANYDVVVFLLTTGDVLDADQQFAFEAYMAAGGGYVGVHSATDTEYDWMFYGDMVGAYFDGHPAPQTATMTVVDADHPSTQHLASSWERFDEWYNFAPDPTDDVDVLLNLDESTYDGGSMGASHPIAWAQEFGGGRVFYTGGGHTSESYAEPDFLQHLRGGIEWAAGGSDAPGTTGTSGPAETSGSSDGSGSPATSTTTSPTTSTTGAPGASSSATGDPTATSAPATDSADSTDDPSADGCGCTHQPHPPPSALTLALLLLLAGPRRRPPLVAKPRKLTRDDPRRRG